MPAEWSGLSELVHDLGELAGIERAIVDEGIIPRLAAQVRDKAVSNLGHYQGQKGPYNAWKSLSKYTQAERVRLGFTADEPLLRTGTMAKEVTFDIEEGGLSALIGLPQGSTSGLYGAVMELGNFLHTIEPRPWLAPALYELSGQIANTFGEHVNGLFRPRLGVLWSQAPP